MSEEIQVRVVSEVPINDIIQLYKDAGWWDEESDNSFVQDIAASSFCFVGAFLGRRMIGMGRALSDGSSDAYIQDVVVLREFRGRGIGREIIRNILDFLTDQGVDWIGLVAQPGTEKFYSHIGFVPMQGHTPMKYPCGKEANP